MIKRMTSSLFSRDKKNKDVAVSEEGILAVWGSPSSGKTTLSIEIAKYIASKKKDCIVLFTDMQSPVIPYIVDPKNLEVEKSLGSMLAGVSVNVSIVMNNCITLKNNNHITLIGMLKGENIFSYPEFTENHIKELLDTLRELAPYVIIDCSSNLTYDMITGIALAEADEVLRLMSPDLKSISYLSSHLPLLEDKDYELDRFYKVASSIKAGQESNIDGATFKLPHSQEIEQNFYEGNMFKSLDLKQSRQYKREVEKIVKEVFGEIR